LNILKIDLMKVLYLNYNFYFNILILIRIIFENEYCLDKIFIK
jgi:hypothetical protein